MELTVNCDSTRSLGARTRYGTRYVEQTLMVHGACMLLVETSGLPDFDRTRSFYRKCGYDEEARIRDFYSAGDDKIVYRKALNSQEQM